MVEIVEKGDYLGNTTEPKGGKRVSGGVGGGGVTVDNVLLRVTSGWSKIRDLMPVLTGSGKLCSACIRIVMLYRSEA